MEQNNAEPKGHLHRINESFKWFFTNYFKRPTGVMLLVDLANAAVIFGILWLFVAYVQKIAVDYGNTLYSADSAVMAGAANKIILVLALCYIAIVVVTAALQMLGYAYFLGKIGIKAKPHQHSEEHKSAKKEYFKKFMQISMFSSLMFTLLLVGMYYLLEWQYNINIGNQAVMNPVVVAALVIGVILTHIYITINTCVSEKLGFLKSMKEGMKKSFTNGYVYLAYFFIAIIYLLVLTLLGYIAESGGTKYDNAVLYTLLGLTVIFFSLAKSANMLLIRPEECSAEIKAHEAASVQAEKKEEKIEEKKEEKTETKENVKAVHKKKTLHKAHKVTHKRHKK